MKEILKKLMPLCVLMNLSVTHAQKTQPLTTGSIVYLDADLKQLLPSTSKIEVIGSGFQHIEGPVWVRDSSLLLFSDTKAQIIYSWSERDGVKKFIEHVGYTGRLPYSEEPGSNGLTIDAENNLIICEHGNRRLAKLPLNGKYGLQTLVDNYKGTRLNSPNDVVIKSDGTVYFTDPPYGLPNKDEDSLKATGTHGVYAFSADKSLKLVSKILFANGLAFSPDESKLYVSSSDKTNTRIVVYDVQRDGSLQNEKLFFSGQNLLNSSPDEVMDGLKVDNKGNVWASGPGGLLLINADGKLLGKITTGEVVSNCAWGEGGMLFITAGNFLYRIQTTSKP